MSVSGKSIEPVLVTPLRSPAARRRARVQARLAWRRLAVRLLVGGVLAAAAVRVGAIAIQPVVATFQAGTDTRELETRYRGELARHNRLQRDIRFLSTNAGVEEEARRLGWVKAGETSLQIVEPATPPRPAVVPQLSGSQRFRRWIESLLQRPAVASENATGKPSR
jgi:hypothetical protein